MEDPRPQALEECREFMLAELAKCKNVLPGRFILLCQRRKRDVGKDEE